MSDANASVRPASADKGLLARHPLVFYFLIAYAGTWLLLLPVALSEDGVGLLPFSTPLGGYLLGVPGFFLGPTLSAFVMTGATEGMVGIRRLLRRFVLWRVGLRWYLFALLGPPAFYALGAIVLPGVLASFETLASLDPLSLLGIFVLVLTIGGPLAEEPGWRGFAQPRLQRLHGPLIGSLILGILWGVWHLPVFFTPNLGPAVTGVLDAVLYVLQTIALAIIFTWVFNNTQGSLLIAILLHTSVDSFLGPVDQLFPALTGYDASLPYLIGFWTLALLLVALTRGRLGYQHYTATASGQHEDELPRTP